MKNIEEIIKEKAGAYADNHAFRVPYNKGIELTNDDYYDKVDYKASFEGYSTGMKEGIEFTQTWYSVEDELPEVNERILVRDDRIDAETVGVYCNDGIFYTDNEMIKHITHWRPININ